MKIFWNDKVGKDESGHSVIVLRKDLKAGTITYWSSNTGKLPGEDKGYGPATRLIGKKGDARPRVIRHAIFTRFDKPENLVKVLTLPAANDYLKKLKDGKSDFDEADAQSGAAR
jgi:hypothetical protein